MHKPIADFSITTARDMTWAAQRARLLGTLASLRPQARNQLAKAVREGARAVLGKPLRGTIQFAMGTSKRGRFLEVIISGKSSTYDQRTVEEALRPLVDRVAIETDDLRGVVVTLRTYLDEDVPRLGSHDIAEWGTMLATRTIEGALVQVQSRLRAIRTSSESSVVGGKDLQVHELLTLVASTTDNSVVVMNALGQVEWINDSFSRMTGYELHEIQGREFSQLLVGPETDEAAVKEIQSAMLLGHGISRDVLHYRKDGTTYWELLCLSPVFDANGAANRWVSIGADISVRRAAEESLAQAKAIAEASSKAKSNFLANISHEIRTPLNAVLGMTELTLATTLTPDQREYLSILKESAEALMGLLNDILDLSKIEVGKLEVDPVPFDLTRLLHYTLRPFSRQARQQGVEFALTIQPDTPAHLIGDATRVRQVLINLVSNALKFTNAGTVMVNVESQWQSEDEVSLHISVSDTGIGMSKETLQKIFDAFVQADSSITREYGGTGLGLTISAGLVELMGGRIWVHSQVGKGSTFHVALPLQKTHEHTTTNAPRGELQTLNGWDGLSRPLQVLIADDNQANCILARRVLEKRGHRVTLVANGREALDSCHAHAFDVAVLDVQMPEIDGLTVAAEIRRAEAAGQPRLPLVAMTAHAMTGDRERCLQAGMDAYLAKPINAREFYTLVENLGGPSAGDLYPHADDLDQRPFAKALARLEGDEELLREQMRFFLDESPDLMDQILAALDEERLELVRVAAHRLKGLAGTVDGGDLLFVANRIEDSSVAGTVDDVTAIIDELAAALTRLTDQVSDYLTS